MEDKARADCNDRIDIPLKVETKIERKQQSTTTLCKALLTAEDKRVEKETKRGSFTKVETKTIISKDRDLKTSITQAWNGTNPDFIKMGIERKIIEASINKESKIIKPDADWNKKYLMKNWPLWLLNSKDSKLAGG